MMKWMLIAALLVSSSGLALVALFTLHWKRRRYSRAPVELELDISDYRVLVLDDETQCEAYFKMKASQDHKFVGFDCEWVSNGGQKQAVPNEVSNSLPLLFQSCPSYYPVALLQLAFPDKQCALVRLSKIGKLTDSLTEILTNKSCLKFGIGIKNDAARLSDWSNTVTVGCVDLRNIALRCGIRRNLSLAGLTKQLTGSVLIKSKEITCSNWEQDTLSDDQILYAARDAIAGLIILDKLVEEKILNKRRHHRTDNDSKDSKCGCILNREKEKSCVPSLCQGIIDIDYSSSSVAQPHKHQTNSRTTAYSVRQTPLYHNCQLLAPDGTLLSTVDRKKVEWYLSKGLGVLENEDPPVLRLLFEPSGKPNEDREYYLTEKENICVVCGRKDGYIRKNVVPHEYRKFFPPKLKEHLSHDVLLLCVTCHQISSRHDSIIKRQLALDYSAPLEASTHKFHEDPEKVKLRSLARALKEHRYTLPEKRKEEIMLTLADHFNCDKDEVTNDMIENLLTLETRLRNPSYVSHGELIVRAVKERGELVEFQQRWRQHFLDCMQPQYLPKLWSVNHNPQ